MKLTQHEEAMARGDLGAEVKHAIEQQIQVGDFWSAGRFVEVTNVHMMGDIEVMGDGGLDHLDCMVKRKARCVIPTTTNARCFDFAHMVALGQDAAEADKEKQLIAHLQAMDVMTTDTCINYQTLYQPHFGEHVAWGDTGTVIYANSVFGARTNFESGPAAMAAALTGRTPAYGFHLDEHRRGTFIVRVEAELTDLADWGALGKLVGQGHQNYFAVPVFDGLDRAASSDELKHLGAALASYGSMGMFHVVGTTPEAPSLEAALGANKPTDEMRITDADIQNVYRSYDLKDGQANLVVFSAPQLSLFEMKHLADLLRGRTVKAGTHVFVTTASTVKSEARRLGYLQDIERAGAVVLSGVCFYILQNLSAMRVRNGWSNLVSNSAKIVNTITAHKFNTILRRTTDCVEIAVTGVLE
jgi:predicted aconitase